MVDHRTEDRIKEIVKIYLEKMDRSDLVIEGVDYFKQLAASIEPKADLASDPETYPKLAELYIWIKMLLITEDISEDVLNGQIDRLYESITSE